MRALRIRSWLLCIVLASPLAAQATWTGSVSNSWNSPGNWSTGAVPTSSTDVVVAFAVNQPASFLVDPECRDLTIDAGATLSLLGGFDLLSTGDLNIEGTLDVLSASSELVVVGDWLNNGTFSGGGATVTLAGSGVLGGTSSSTFEELVVTGGVRTVTTAFAVDDGVSVEGGAAFDLGALTHTVAGNWISSGVGVSVSGAGTIDFTGNGLLITAGNSLPNVRVSSGVRSVNTSAIAGNLELLAGTLQILDNAVLSVGGNATLTGGTLGWTSSFAGLEAIDVAGDVLANCAAGATGADARFDCGGSWSSNASFVMAAGTVRLDGGGTETVGGSTPSFPNLQIVSGSFTFTQPTLVAGNLTINSGNQLNADAPLDVNGNVLMGDGTAGWSLGGFDHTVAGNFSSFGADASGPGSLILDGSGTLTPGGGTLANLTVSAGTRVVSNTLVLGDLALTGGELAIADGQTLAVAGNGNLSAGVFGWLDTTAGAETLDVEGDLSITSAAGGSSPNSRIECAGNWTSSAAFAPAFGTVVLDGAGARSLGGAGVSLADLQILTGVVTVQSASAMSGSLTISSGATLVSNGALDVSGPVTLGDATAAWDMGGLTHTVGGSWVSSGASANNGTVLFDATGALNSGGGAIANVRVAAGSRNVSTTTVSGNLELVGGALQILDDQTLTVGGNALLTGGILNFEPTLAGGLEIVDVAGDVLGQSTVTLTSANAVIRCAGDWSSDASFAPAEGTIELDGTIAVVGGTGTTLPNLSIISGAKQVQAPITLTGNLRLESGAVLDTEAALDVAGDVTLGNATATWDLSAFAHRVVGDWTSGGASATGASGSVVFDGTGSLDTGSGSISNVLIQSGTRTVITSNVSDNLSMTGGTLLIGDNQLLSVDGDATLTAGTLAFEDLTGGEETLSVTGNMNAACAVGATSATTRIECAGNWSSTAAFAPALGTTIFVGAGATTIGGTAPNLANVRVDAGTKTLTADLSVNNFVLVSGAAFIGSAVLDVNGQVLLGDGTASWDLGGLTHTVALAYTSAGCSATGGTIEFDGIGGLDTGGGSIANVIVSAGNRNVLSSSVTGNLTLVDGLLRVLNDSTLTVGGNLNLLGGSVSWEPTPGGVLETIAVAGDVLANAIVGTSSPAALLTCGGDWTSDGTFAPTSGLVQFDGGGTHTIAGAAPTFFNVQIVAGDTNLTSNALVSGNLTLNSGNTLACAASFDVDGGVLMGDASAVWDLGAFTHTVAVGWTSAGGSATGAGTVEFDSTGIVSTSTGSIANVAISSGDRLCSGANVAGNFLMTGGGLLIDTDQTLNVGGDFAATAGSLGWDLAAGGPLETIDVEGNVTVLAMLLSETTDSRFFCGGDWSSSSAFAPVLGEVVLDGGSVASVSGAAPIFPNLRIESGTKTVLSAATVNGSLEINSGALLETDAALDIDGNVALGDASAAWDLGTSLVHTVAGFWASLGGSAVDLSSTIEFDGAGSMQTGGGSITNVLVTSGDRRAFDTILTGDLGMTGGSFVVDDNQTVAVAGNVDFSAGLLGFSDTTAGVETLDVEGDVSLLATSGATSSNTQVFCAGNWNSTSAFDPAAGTFTLDGGSTTSVTGAGGITLADVVVASGTKTVANGLELDDLVVASGAGLVTNGVLDATGSVVVGDASASWDMGGLEHQVTGSWTSSGASATNGTVEFDGAGSLATAPGSIANVRSIAGARGVSDTNVTGTLELAGGNMTLLENQSLLVGGDAILSSGGLNFAGAADGTAELLDVEGSLFGTATVTATSTDTLVRCAGNWTSNGSFALTAGTVELDGAGTTQLTGAGPGLDPVFDEVIVRGGTRVVGSDLSVTSNRWTIEPGAGVSIAGFDAALPGATTLVQGELTLLAGARLALDAGSLLNVASTGTLRMLGTVADEAAIIGAAGGGYLLSIDGFLSATNFRFEGMGATGVTLTRLATLDVAPNDLRSGVFARPSSAAGSALLDIRRALPATFTNVDFEDPLGVGTFNVRTTAGAAIVFRNSGGNLAGEDFDDDPFEFVTWETDADVTLASFFATPASEEISVDWSTSAESAVDAFVLRRSLGTGGPYALVGEVPAAGPSAYQIVDTGLVNGQLYEYQLSVRPLAGPEQVLGLVTETPSGPDLPPNVATVGPMGLFPDIQSAINAATGPRPVISVAPGTYASFSVTPGIGGVLRIAADGTGPVVIDTNLAPVQLLNLGATESVELSDLTIGDGSGTNAGIVIQNVIATVVLDELVVQGGAGAAGVLVDASGQVAVQRSALTGSPGLDVSNGSLVFASKGSTSAFSVRGFSTATTCELTGTPTVEPGSTLNALAGVMPDVDLPEFAALGGSFTVTVSGDLGNLWFLLYSFDLSWLPLPAPGFEMVGLGGLSVTILQSGFFGGSASAALPLGLPAAPSFAGLPIVLQSVGVNPVSTVVRFSNVASIVGLNP